MIELGKFMKKTRALAIICYVYIMAIGVGVVTAWILTEHTKNVILTLLCADIAATLVVFISSIPLKNASVYDPYWSIAPPCLVVGYYVLAKSAFSLVHLLVIVPLCFWAIRLTYNWVIGFTDLKWEDWRYVNFKKANPKTYIFINLTGIMLMPTLLVFAGMIPFYYFITGSENIIAAAFSGAIIMSATVYQTIADAQKRKFLKNPKNKGKVMDTGLWKFSRHPNYFGEVSVWWGMFVCGLGNLAWQSVFGAPMITLLFIFISIPLMNKHMLKTRPTYPEYKAKVRSPLIPLPPRKTASQESK